METTISTTINPITEAFSKLAKSLGDRKSLDYLIENYDQETLKTELVNFSKTYLLSTVQTEMENMKKYKRKLSTFDELVKYLIKNVCSKDGLRPAMCKVYNDQKKGNLVATDAHILACLPLQNLPICDSLDNICKEDLNEYYRVYSYPENSFKLDKYNDLVNEDLEDKYPDYMQILPEANYLDYPYFSINPYLFNGLKIISKIAKKLKIDIFFIRLNCLEYTAYLNLSLLVRYIDLHQKLYGNYAFLALTRNGYDGNKCLYNVDITEKYRLLLMPCIKTDEDIFLDLDL
jgi:hypothetical protein